ncbi:lipase family protein [Neobacillus bataviensis]|uniref:lipase family protein n=1 Tax=Neobacillus bataviensis TaxID=220685 RepID=UPI001CBBC218|nr:hypothetical protein [Neobacillus bataviensis]
MAEELRNLRTEPLTKYNKTFKWLIKRVKKKRRTELERILSEWYCIGSVFEVYKKYPDVPNVKLDAFVFKRKLNAKNVYLLSFRGTNPLSPRQFYYDMKENLDLNIKQKRDDTQFGQAVTAIIAFVELIIKENEKYHYQFARNPSETLYYITGHSKGGGLAHAGYIYLLENNKKHSILTEFGPLSELNIYSQIKTSTFCPTPLIGIERWTQRTKEWNCTINNIDGDRVIKLLTWARKIKLKLLKQTNDLSEDYLSQYLNTPQILKKKGLLSFFSLKHDLKTFDDYFN